MYFKFYLFKLKYKKKFGLESIIPVRNIQFQVARMFQIHFFASVAIGLFLGLIEEFRHFPDPFMKWRRFYKNGKKLPK